MFLDLNFWQEIMVSLKKNRIRTVLTAFGIFWGIFMLIVMAGAGKGLENKVTESFDGVATNSAFVWANRTGEPYKGYKRGRQWSLYNEDMIAIKNNIPEIETIVPRVNGYSRSTGDNTSRGDKSGSYGLYGDYPEFQIIDPVTIIHGRFINQSDIIQKRKVCMIGFHVYEVLFPKNEYPIGKFIRVNNTYYQVIGVFKPKNEGGFGGDKNEAIYFPFTTLQLAYNYGNLVGYFAFTAKSGYAVSDVEEKVMAFLKVRKDIAPNDNDAIGHFNLEEIFKKIMSIFIGIQLLTWIVGIGTLLAGVIGVSNIMLVIVKERTHEIGIMRALGATPKFIVTQIITESVVLTTFAGYFGLSLGMGLLQFAKMALGNAENVPLKNPDISLATGIITLTILIISGACAGILPALRAVRMKTIDALREEI